MHPLDLVKDLLRQALTLLEGTVTDGRIHLWSAGSFLNGQAALAVILAEPEKGESVLTQVGPASDPEEANLDALYLGLSHLCSRPSLAGARLLLHLASPALFVFLDDLEVGDPAPRGRLSSYLPKLEMLKRLVNSLKAVAEVEISFSLEEDHLNHVRCQLLADRCLRQALAAAEASSSVSQG